MKQITVRTYHISLVTTTLGLLILNQAHAD